MKFAQLFPHTRRVEQDNARLKRERKRLAHSNAKHAEVSDSLETLLRACEQRQIEYGKITLKEVEEILTALVDYHETLHLLSAPDPIRIRVKDIFDKYDIKVLTPTTWHPNSQ